MVKPDLLIQVNIKISFHRQDLAFAHTTHIVTHFEYLSHAEVYGGILGQILFNYNHEVFGGNITRVRQKFVRVLTTYRLKVILDHRWVLIVRVSDSAALLLNFILFFQC